jgi:hypothetical protein
LPTTEQEFHETMIGLYKEAKEEDYTPSAFLDMVYRMGGLAAAKQLINDPQPSDGFRRLWEMGRLDLTVEYVVAFESKFHSLFTQSERLAARRRYEEYKGRPV